ncbi:MAG: hypothetical protein AAGB13_10400 [Cyanobacteria bacterium P01_F01_bin.33]
MNFTASASGSVEPETWAGIALANGGGMPLSNIPTVAPTNGDAGDLDFMKTKWIYTTKQEGGCQ